VTEGEEVGGGEEGSIRKKKLTGRNREEGANSPSSKPGGEKSVGEKGRVYGKKKTVKEKPSLGTQGSAQEMSSGPTGRIIAPKNGGGFFFFGVAHGKERGGRRGGGSL